MSETFLEYAKNNASKLINEWDYKLNNKNPESFAPKSGKSVHWICKKGHRWEAKISDRVRGNGCPYCGRKRPIIGENDLATVNPNLAAEWNYEKNEKQPYEFLPKSGKKVWWKCAFGHEWEATIDSRSRGNGCKYCAGQATIQGVNDIETLYPRLVLEWDYEKNGDIKPTDIMPGSNKKIWWKCSEGHSWCISPNNRTSQNSNCPKCSAEIGTSFPEQAILFYLSQVCNARNRVIIDGYEIDIYIDEYKLGIEYDGILYHNSEDSKKREQRKNDFLKEKKISLFRIKETRTATINDEENVFYRKIGTGSTKLEECISWALNLIQERGADISNVDINLKKDDIKIYSNYLSLKKKYSLAVQYPELLQEWDYKKNEGIKPETVMPGTHKKVWWICEKGHSYKSAIYHRTSADEPTSCPICSGQKILTGFNDFATLRPDLLREWDYKINDVSPNLISANSTKKVNWICSKGHSYIASITKRNHGRNCPVCSGKKIIVGINDLATMQPELIKDWDYSKNEMQPENYTEHSNKRVYWKCSKCQFEWEAQISMRSYGRGCPNCNKNRVRNHIK